MESKNSSGQQGEIRRPLGAIEEEVVTMTVLVTDDRLSDRLSGGLSDARERRGAAVAQTVPALVDHPAFPGRPTGLAVAPDGTRYVSDTASGTIWRIDAEGIASVFLAPHGPFADATDPQMRLL